MGHCFQHFQESKIKSKPALASTTQHRSVVILTGQTRENKKTPYFVGNTCQDCWSVKRAPRRSGVGTGDGNVNCGDDNGEGRGNGERGGGEWEWSGVEWGDKETAIWNSRTL